MTRASVPTLAELATFFAQAFPQNSVLLEAMEGGGMIARQPVGDEHLRPGQTVMGPVMMTLADTAAYACLLSRNFAFVEAVTSSLNISFLARPAADADLIAQARPLKMGKRLAVVDVLIHSEGEEEPVAHATVTYALPRL